MIVIDIRFFYEKERNNLSIKIQRLNAEIEALQETGSQLAMSELESNVDDSNVSMFSVKISELNDRCMEIQNKANNEILRLRQQCEEDKHAMAKLEKLLIRSQNEVGEVEVSKSKEITTLNNKLMQIEKSLKMEDRKTHLLLKKKICALRCNMSKMEASNNKLEEKIKQVETELEAEKLVNRKRRANDKTQSSKYDEMTSRLAKTIEVMQNKLRQLEKENAELESKQEDIKQIKVLGPQKKYSNLTNVLSRKESITTVKKKNCGSKKLRKVNQLIHSQSNDALLLKSSKRSGK